MGDFHIETLMLNTWFEIHTKNHSGASLLVGLPSVALRLWQRLLPTRTGDEMETKIVVSEESEGKQADTSLLASVWGRNYHIISPSASSQHNLRGRWSWGVSRAADSKW